MALDELDEHERGERVRQWMRQNGAAIVMGIGAGIAALAGWQYWQAHKREHAAQAQSAYQALLDAESRGDAAAVEAAAAKLRDGYADTAYGAFAALAQARDALGKGDYAAAESALQWARGAGLGIPALASLVELRLAQVKLAKGDAQGALDALGRMGAGLYAGPAADVRGDALAALGRVDEARSAYEQALASLDAGSPQRDFVEMKRDDLASTAVASDAAPAAAAKVGS